eukprot:40217-Chlamydomonas_euryale.AAC.1
MPLHIACLYCCMRAARKQACPSPTTFCNQRKRTCGEAGTCAWHGPECLQYCAGGGNRRGLVVASPHGWCAQRIASHLHARTAAQATAGQAVPTDARGPGDDAGASGASASASVAVQAAAHAPTRAELCRRVRAVREEMAAVEDALAGGAAAAADAAAAKVEARRDSRARVGGKGKRSEAEDGDAANGAGQGPSQNSIGSAAKAGKPLPGGKQGSKPGRSASAKQPRIDAFFGRTGPVVQARRSGSNGEVGGAEPSPPSDLQAALLQQRLAGLQQQERELRAAVRAAAAAPDGGAD